MALALAGGPAGAQTAAETLRLENQLAIERGMDRQRALANEREAYARQQRAQTQTTVQSLQGAVTADTRIASDAEAIARRQAAELAASNARILAIRPASE